MSRILEHVKDAVNAVTDSEAPVNEDGATPRPSYFSRKITDIQERVIRGPGFTLNDLVSLRYVRPAARHRGSLLKLIHGPRDRAYARARRTGCAAKGSLCAVTHMAGRRSAATSQRKTRSIDCLWLATKGPSGVLL